MSKKYLLALTVSCMFSASAEANEPVWPTNDEEIIQTFKSLPILPYKNPTTSNDGWAKGVPPSDFPANVAAFAFVDSKGCTGIALRYDYCESIVLGGPCTTQVYSSTITQQHPNDPNVWVSKEHYGANILISDQLKNKATAKTIRPPHETCAELTPLSLAQLLKDGSVAVADTNRKICMTIFLKPEIVESKTFVRTVIDYIGSFLRNREKYWERFFRNNKEDL